MGEVRLWKHTTSEKVFVVSHIIIKVEIKLVILSQNIKKNKSPTI
jgi:hypothetical protein